jgi:hypothetical protein
MLWKNLGHKLLRITFIGDGTFRRSPGEFCYVELERAGACLAFVVN